MEKFVVTIGREFGSSGKEIGRELAWQLGVECYDRSMVEKAAEEAGIPQEEVAMADETVSASANRMVYGQRYFAGNDHAGGYGHSRTESGHPTTGRKEQLCDHRGRLR